MGTQRVSGGGERNGHKHQMYTPLAYLFLHLQKHGTTQRGHSLEAGLDVKYLIMRLCIEGTRHKHSTTAFTAIIPGKHEQQKAPHYKGMWDLYKYLDPSQE